MVLGKSVRKKEDLSFIPSRIKSGQVHSLIDFRLNKVYLKHIEHIVSVEQTGLIVHQGFRVFQAFGFVTYFSPRAVPQSVQFFSSAQGRQSPRHGHLHESMAMKGHWGLSEGVVPSAKVCCIFSC